MTMSSGGERGHHRWVPIFGEFETSDDKVVYRGRRVPLMAKGSATDEPQEQAGIGLILSNQLIGDGAISLDVTAAAVTPETTCEIAIAYDPNATHLVTAGLGSEAWAMFGIREYGGPKTAGSGWWDHRVSGDRVNFKPQRHYTLEAHLRGATVSLSIDGVSVATAEVTSPLGRPRNVGVFCRGDHLITVAKFHVQSSKPRAFVVMQFGPDFDPLYQDVVKEICNDFEVNVLRADEVNGPGFIIADIVREIGTSQLVIADITPANPNVYFEVGYALALGKPTILLARKGTPLPFDIAGFRVLFYEDTIGGKRHLEEGLRRHLDALLAA